MAQNRPERAAFDESLITLASRRFATDLFAHFPEFYQHVAMQRWPASEEWNLVVTVPARSGDPAAELVVYVEEEGCPSVAFGRWHTHEGVWGADLDYESDRAALFDLIAGILEDRFILCEGVGDPDHVTPGVLDQTDEDGLLEELTSPYCHGRVRLRSWSGHFDREVGLDDLDP